MSKQRRNRRPAPEPLATGDVLATWQSNPHLIRHAQTDEHFKRVLTVLTNERINAVTRVPLMNRTPSESYLFGVQQGYEAALVTMNLMTRGPEPIQPKEPEATYDSPEKDFDTLTQSPS